MAFILVILAVTEAIKQEQFTACRRAAASSSDLQKILRCRLLVHCGPTPDTHAAPSAALAAPSATPPTDGALHLARELALFSESRLTCLLIRPGRFSDSSFLLSGLAHGSPSHGF